MSDNAAIESQLWHLREQEKNIIQILEETEKTQKKTVEDWDVNINRRRDLKAEEIDFPKEENSIYIKNKLEARGWTEGQIHHVVNYLPKGSKRYYEFGEAVRDSNVQFRTFENLSTIDKIKFITKALRGITEEQIIECGKIEGNKEAIIEYLEQTGVSHKQAANACYALGWISDKDKDKIYTWKPDPNASLPYNAVVELIPEYKQAFNYLDDKGAGVAKKMFEYSPSNATSEQEQLMADQINSLTLMQSTINKLWKSCKDEKFSFSLWEHARMQMKEELYSKHGAAKKSSVQIIDKDGNVTKEFRSMTRERVGDSKEQMFNWMQDMSAAMKAYAFWMGFVEWRDVYSEINGRIADRKKRLSPVLSDAA